MEGYADSQSNRFTQLRSSSLTKNFAPTSSKLGELIDRENPSNIYSTNRNREAQHSGFGQSGQTDEKQRNPAWFLEPQQDLSNMRVIRRSHNPLQQQDQPLTSVMAPPNFMNLEHRTSAVRTQAPLLPAMEQQNVGFSP